MYRISLVNMPFASAISPSLALTQLRSVILSRSYSNPVSVDIAYANLDFASHFGRPAYEYVSSSHESLYAGFGDWLFRQTAFPTLPDNRIEYFQRHFWRKKEKTDFVGTLITNHLDNIEKYIEDVIDLYSLDQADIVGMTSTFMQNVASFALARLLKRRNPNAIIVMGGSNCHFPMGQIIADKVEEIDYVFSGPALKSFPSFIQAYIDGRMSTASSIPGVLVSRNSCSVPKQGTIGNELDINTAIELDYDDFIGKLGRSPIYSDGSAVYHFETSRGCWWGQRSHCTFCGLNGDSMAYNAMLPDIAIEQFRKMFLHADKFGTFIAVDNICPKSYFRDVFPRLRPPAGVKLFYEVKADLTAQDISVLDQASIRTIQPGIESLATSTLKLMKKGTTASQNIGLLKLCTLYDVTPVWNLLVGFPGESAEVYRHYLELLPLLSHLAPPAGVFPVRFDRFSPYHSHPENYGLDLHPMDFYSFVYPFDGKSLEDFAYYFSDHNVSAEYFVDVAKWIRKLEKVVNDWRNRWSARSGSLATNLYFKREDNCVVDTRTGVRVEHEIGRGGVHVLDHLRRARRRDELDKLLYADHGDNGDRIIEDLEQKGLLFREGDRLLSLVLEGPRGSYSGKWSLDENL